MPKLFRARFVCLLLFVATVGFASVTTYPTLAAWSANASQVTVIDFSGYTPSSGVVYLASPLNISGVKFQATSYFAIVGAGYTCCHIIAPNAPFTLYEESGAAGADEKITLPPNVTAISFRTTNGCEPNCTQTGGTIQLKLSDGTILTVNDAPGGHGEFVGFTSTVAISSIILASGGNPGNNYIALADFRFGTAYYTTQTSLDVCRRLVNPGQPVCFSTQTNYVTRAGTFSVDDGMVNFIDELTNTSIGTAPVNGHGVAYLCLPITHDVEVYARYSDMVDYDGRPSTSNEVPVFVSPTGVYPGCLLHAY